MFRRVKILNMQPDDAFKLSCVGWAGALAERMQDEGGADGEPNEFATSVFNYFYDDDLGELSEMDQYLIELTPFRWRACKTAAMILDKNWSGVNEYAGYIDY